MREQGAKQLQSHKQSFRAETQITRSHVHTSGSHIHISHIHVGHMSPRRHRTCTCSPSLTLMWRWRDYRSSQLHPTTVKMNTRSHQNRITALAQEAVDVKQYFRFWTRDTALTLDTIRTLQHLSLLSRTPPKCHCGADKQLYQTQIALTDGNTVVLDTAAEHGRAYDTTRGSTGNGTPSPTTFSWSACSTANLPSNR